MALWIALCLLIGFDLFFCIMSWFEIYTITDEVTEIAFEENIKLKKIKFPLWETIGFSLWAVVPVFNIALWITLIVKTDYFINLTIDRYKQ